MKTKTLPEILFVPNLYVHIRQNGDEFTSEVCYNDEVQIHQKTDSRAKAEALVDATLEKMGLSVDSRERIMLALDCDAKIKVVKELPQTSKLNFVSTIKLYCLE